MDQGYLKGRFLSDDLMVDVPEITRQGSGVLLLRDTEGARADANRHGDCLIVPVKRSFTRWLVAMAGHWLRTRLNAMVQLHRSQREVARKTRRSILCSVSCVVWLNTLAISLHLSGMASFYRHHPCSDGVLIAVAGVTRAST